MPAPKHKRILFTPTDWHIDVLVSKDLDAICRKLKKVCGKHDWKKEVDILYDQQKQLDKFGGIVFTPDTGYACSIMILHSLNAQLVVHECVHAIWHLDAQVGFMLNYDNQEIQAYYVDYLFAQIMKMK